MKAFYPRSTRLSLLNHRSLTLMAATGLTLFSGKTFGALYDVIVYNDKDMLVHGLTVGKDENNEDSIMVHACPMETIRNISQCSDPQPVVTVREFNSFVKRVVSKGAAKGTPMAPLTTDDLLSIKLRDEASANTALAKDLGRIVQLREQKIRLEKLLSDFPGSTGFSTELTAVNQELKKLELTSGKAAVVMDKAKEVDARLEVHSEKLLKLILENSIDPVTRNPLPTAHVNSQNLGTLPFAVMNALVTGAGGTSVEVKGVTHTTFRDGEGRLVYKVGANELIISKAAKVSEPAQLVVLKEKVYVFALGGNSRFWVWTEANSWSPALSPAIQKFESLMVISGRIRIRVVRPDGKRYESFIDSNYTQSAWTQI